MKTMFHTIVRGMGLLLLAAATLGFFSTYASATAIVLNNGTAPQPTSSGDTEVGAWLITVITDYNSTHGTNLPTTPVGAHPDVKVDPGGSAPLGYPTFPSNTLSITLPANLNDYLVLHWGGPHGGVFQAFDLMTIPEVSDTFNAPSHNGLSFYSFYGIQSTPVPEPGSLVLCVSGIVGLAGTIRRKLKA